MLQTFTKLSIQEPTNSPKRMVILKHTPKHKKQTKKKTKYPFQWLFSTSLYLLFSVSFGRWSSSTISTIFYHGNMLSSITLYVRYTHFSNMFSFFLVFFEQVFVQNYIPQLTWYEFILLTLRSAVQSFTPYIVNRKEKKRKKKKTLPTTFKLIVKRIIFFLSSTTEYGTKIPYKHFLLTSLKTVLWMWIK